MNLSCYQTIPTVIPFEDTHDLLKFRYSVYYIVLQNMRGGYDENIGYTKKVQYHSQSGCECWKENSFVCWYLRSSHVETGSFHKWVWIALSEWSFSFVLLKIRWARQTMHCLVPISAGNWIHEIQSMRNLCWMNFCSLKYVRKWLVGKQAGFQLGYKSWNLFEMKQLNLTCGI